MYSPVDPKIKSPRQIEKKAEKVAARTELKQSDKSKMGKRNKTAGRTDEVSLVKRLQKYGFDAERMPLSGSLGGKYDNDIHLHLTPTYTIKIENKRRKDLHKYYDLAQNNTEIITFCNIMNEESFIKLCRGEEINIKDSIPDKGNSELHKYFNQDACDIVTLHEVRKQWVFCVPDEIIEKIKKEINND